MPAFSAHEFVKFPLLRQAQFLFSHGRELMSRLEGDYIVKLYSIEAFYVEVWYLQLLNKIIRVEIVDMEDVIPAYEDEIDISDAYR
ncbi:MAG: hypothetical protein WCO63_02500 [Bacteroidota bacterium]